MAHRPAPHQPKADATGLTRPGMARVLLDLIQQNVFFHRRVVQLGPFEFVLQAIRTDVHGLTEADYRWIFAELQRTRPPDLKDLPNGTVLNEQGHPVPATAEDLANIQRMLDGTHQPRRRVILG